MSNDILTSIGRWPSSKRRDISIPSLCRHLLQKAFSGVKIQQKPEAETKTEHPSTFNLIFLVPEPHLSACKAAVFAAGAGCTPRGEYTECCWTTTGTAEFRPGGASDPYIGSRGTLEHVPEVRVETLCFSEAVARRAVQALKKAHPYEIASYQVIRLERF